MVTNLGLLVQLCGGEGGTLQINITGVCVGGACSVWTTLDLPQLKAACASQVYTAQAPGCSARGLLEVGPAFRVLPSSKLLRFRGTPQGHTLCWTCILCPSQVQAAQVTRCLVSTLSQVGCVF